MSKTDDLLVEIGTEELPPKALRALMDAFGENLAAGLDDARLARGDVDSYASPRRLSVIVRNSRTRSVSGRLSRKARP